MVISENRNISRVNVDRLVKLVIPAGVVDMAVAVDHIERKVRQRFYNRSQITESIGGVP